jgi:RNA polymerase sigma factor (sigma-70 family)
MLTDKEFERRLVDNQYYLLGYAKVLTRTSTEYDAEDLLQDTNLRAWEKRDYYKSDDSITGWLCFMMHNIFINNILKTKIKIYTERDDSDMLPLVERFASSSINEGEGNMVLDLIDEAINKLDAKDRDIVQRYISGESQASIGKSYNMKDNAIKQRYFHAIKIVRAALLNEGVEFNNFISNGTKEKQALYRKKQTSMEHNIRKKLDKQKNND